MNSIILDVREKDEYDAEHIKDSISIPLSEFERCAPALLKSYDGKSVVLMCRSGKRAELAAKQAQAHGLGAVVVPYKGGLLEWKKQGNPTVCEKRRHLPLMRQVQLIAGILVLTGVVLSVFVNSNFIYLSGFVGAGLSIAGATGFCGMAEILARMPWNKKVSSINKELCEVSSSSSACVE
ncbi:MAG: rhodanese-like domain-containing protein [Bacteriovoracia bacterium]